ncbi:hypothetical protein Ahy_A07g033933 [Arachis hypogaea]|uniref:DYW domain-containing protein n=1 Tax=Arachis hypogaea TaxID=3818 RepID=A0A445CAL8_ARAHY|nr:hypothetical protein Ahy_A07g033933 [Arachis hypogaea]
MSHVFSLSPTIEHYGCIVDLLSCVGLFVEAHNLNKSMPMKPNTIVLGGIIGRMRLHCDTKLAEPMLKQVIDGMKQKKECKKLPGSSWVEVDGVVHEFLVGDTSHPMSPKIFEKHERLFKELREVGYSPTTEFVFFDIEEKEKEYFLGCHSEKFAVAFSLIKTGANDIICVVKNLCVCDSIVSEKVHVLVEIIELKHCLLHGLNSFNHLKTAHCRLLRLNIDHDNYLLNIILQYSFFFCNTPYAKRIISQSKNPKIYLFNTMICETVSSDSFEDAVLFYNSMGSAGLAEFPFGVKLHSLVKIGFDCDVFVKTSLVCLYSKCGYVKDARKVFNVFLRRILFRGQLLSVGILGVAFTRKRLLLEVGVKLNNFTLVRVLYSCSQLGDLASGEWIDNYITESGFYRNVFVLTSSVDMYAKYGSMEKALQVFDRMVERDIVCWSAMIQGYASNGLPKEALDLFFEMQMENLRPDCYAMVGVLSACARLGALELGNWAKGLMDIDEFLLNHHCKRGGYFQNDEGEGPCGVQRHNFWTGYERTCLGHIWVFWTNGEVWNLTRWEYFCRLTLRVYPCWFG